MTRVMIVTFTLALLLAGCLCPPCPATPTPVPTATPPPGPACWDQRLDDIGVTLERRAGQYGLIAAWVTVNGNWNDVPACAQAWQHDTLGGDHHAFGRVETAGGMAIQDTFALVWPGGGDTRMPEANGWANLVLAGQNWDPGQGQGPYDFFVYGGDKLHGLGMPWNNHWSFFAVWRLRQTLHEFDAQLMEVK